MNIMDYVPHAITTLAGTVVTGAVWVFKRHDERDDARFTAVREAFQDVNAKLDTAIQKQADNHAKILEILLQQKDS